MAVTHLSGPLIEAQYDCYLPLHCRRYRLCSYDDHNKSRAIHFRRAPVRADDNNLWDPDEHSYSTGVVIIRIEVFVF